MLARTINAHYLVLGISCLSMLAQQNSEIPAFHGTTEFPVMMQQSIVAGKTTVGTKIRAKLQVATLVDGSVLPRNAVLSGEVIESAAKSARGPSQLAIRMDSAQWTNGSAAINVYLTAWYYPTTQETGQNLRYGPPQSPTRTWNGQGAYPNPNSGSYKPFPGGDLDADKTSVPETTTTKTSDHRVLMKDVDTVRSHDGTLMLVSQRTNIKLDKLTTYVFAPSGVVPKK